MMVITTMMKLLVIVFNVDDEAGDGCDEGGVVLQGEDEAMFMDYRKQMRVIFNNLAQLVSFSFSLLSSLSGLWLEYLLFLKTLFSKELEVRSKKTG